MTQDNQFVSTFEIKTFLLQISEKINDKNLLKFLKTQLSLNDYELNENDFLGAIYLEESNKQFIFASKESNKNFCFEIFYDELEKHEHKFICVICCDVLYIYKYKKLYYFQALDYSFEKDEISNLIFEKLNIRINEFIDINSEKFEELKKKKISNSMIKNLNKSKKINWFRIFIAYILLLIFFTSYILYDKYKQKPLIIQENYYSYKSKKLQSMITLLNENDIFISEMSFDKKVKVLVQIDKSLYSQNLLNILKKKFNVINSNFDKNENQYKVELHGK